MTVECGSCGRVIPDGAPLCLAETADLARALRAVPDLLGDLELTRTRQDRLTSGQGARRSNDTPVPWKEQVPDVVWSLGNTLTTWARDLAGARGLHLPAARLPARPARAMPPGARSDPAGRPAMVTAPRDRTVLALLHAASWLAEHTSQLRTLDDAVQAHDEITDAIARARVVVDRPADRRFVGPCGHPLVDGHDEPLFDRDGEPVTCDRDLYVPPGAVVTSCPAGHPEVDVSRRREYLLEVAQDEVVPVVDASRILAGLVGDTLPPSTVRTWISRSQLAVVRYLHLRPGLRPIYVTERQSPRDQPCVRVGDVTALALRRERAQADTPTRATGS